MTSCRHCNVGLTAENARRSRGRWVGLCRRCESVDSARRAGDRAVLHVTPRTHARIKEFADQMGMGLQWVTDRLLNEALDRAVDPSEFTLTRREDEDVEAV